MATKSNPSDVAQLGQQVGGDNAAAIAEFVDGRIALALDMLADRLTELVSRQMANVAAAKADGSPEAAKSANAGTKAVKTADEAVKKAETSGDPEDAAKAKAKVEEAEQSVSKTEADLAARVSAVEATLAPWREGEELGSRPASRFDPIEEDLVACRDQITALRGGFDQVASASAEALAIAQSGGGRAPALWVVSIVTFVVALIVAGILAIFTPLTFFWDAWWLAAGTTMFVVLCTAILDWAAPVAKGFAQGRAQARSRWRRRDAATNDAGLGIMEPHEAAAEADADAEVDHGRSVAGARASAS